MATISLEDVAADSHTIQVDMGRLGPLDVTYRVYAVTPEIELRRRALDATTIEGMRELLSIFGAIVSDWGLTGPLPADGSLVAAGEQCPTNNTDVLLKLGTPLLSKVLSACMEAPVDPKSSTQSKA